MMFWLDCQKEDFTNAQIPNSYVRLQGCGIIVYNLCDYNDRFAGSILNEDWSRISYSGHGQMFMDCFKCYIFQSKPTVDLLYANILNKWKKSNMM